METQLEMVTSAVLRWGTSNDECIIGPWKRRVYAGGLNGPKPVSVIAWSILFGEGGPSRMDSACRNSLCVNMVHYNIAEVGRKMCFGCGEVKSLEQYSADFTNGSSGYVPRCKDCKSEEWKQQSPEKKRRWSLAKQGWTPEMWESALNIHEGTCVVPGCDSPATDADHDHETGEARDPMCGNCNRALGLMMEDAEKIRGLAEYAARCDNARKWACV